MTVDIGETCSGYITHTEGLRMVKQANETIMTKHRVVLERLPRTLMYLPEEVGFGPVVTLAEDAFNDMGRPDTITVTVEPGDKLTDE